MSKVVDGRVVAADFVKIRKMLIAERASLGKQNCIDSLVFSMDVSEEIRSEQIETRKMPLAAKSGFGKQSFILPRAKVTRAIPATRLVKVGYVAQRRGAIGNVLITPALAENLARLGSTRRCGFRSVRWKMVSLWKKLTICVHRPRWCSVKRHSSGVKYRVGDECTLLTKDKSTAPGRNVRG
jgi:hypothetical protein